MLINDHQCSQSAHWSVRGPLRPSLVSLDQIKLHSFFRAGRAERHGAFMLPLCWLQVSKTHLETSIELKMERNQFISRWRVFPLLYLFGQICNCQNTEPRRCRKSNYIVKASISCSQNYFICALNIFNIFAFSANAIGAIISCEI